MKLLSLLLLSTTLWAVDAPQNWAGAGASYDQFSSPQVSGWAAFATELSNKGPIYSFTEYMITSSRAKPYTVQTATTTGLATTVKQLGPLTIMGFGNVGISAAQSSAGMAYTGGGVGILSLDKIKMLKNWDLVLGAQVLKTNQSTQTIYSFGIGKRF